MKEMVIVLEEKDKDYLADIRCNENILVGIEDKLFSEDEEGRNGLVRNGLRPFPLHLIWVKIKSAKNIDLSIQKLPAKARYILDKDNLLFPLNGLTPTGKLPELKWQPISEYISLEFPKSISVGKVEETYKIKLVATDIFQKGQALLTDFKTWKNYTETAPEIRLSRLRFAVSDNQQVLIIGEPLPPIQGSEYWLLDDLLLPCGYNLAIPIISSLISAKLNPAGMSFILFDNNNWQKIFKENFVQASRSAVRLTSESLAK